MKYFAVIPLLLLVISSFAQEPSGMNDSATQKMMADMQKLQDCMANIDQSQFGEIERRQQQFEKEVKPLCASGRRDEAQKRATKFSEEMAGHPVFKEIRKCSKLVNSDMAKEILPDTEFDAEGAAGHVCDEL